VTVVTIDSLTGGRRVTGMKVDVEGFEIETSSPVRRPRLARDTG